MLKGRDFRPADRSVIIIVNEVHLHLDLSQRLEDEWFIRGRVVLLDSEKPGLGLTAFVLIKTQQHNSRWYQELVEFTKRMPELY
jgi:DNA-binding Lrp family transcriptional regulator